MTSRRKVLTILGGGLVVAAASGSWVLTRDPAAARAPWAAAGDTSSRRLYRRYDRGRQVRDIAWRAMAIEKNTPAAAIESIDLTRIGRAEIEANPDAYRSAVP